MRPLREVLEEETWYVNRFNEVFVGFRMMVKKPKLGTEIEAKIIYAYLHPELMPEGVIDELAKILYTDGDHYFIAEMTYKKGPYDKHAKTEVMTEKFSCAEELQEYIQDGMWGDLLNLESGNSANEELKLIFDIDQPKTTDNGVQ